MKRFLKKTLWSTLTTIALFLLLLGVTIFSSFYTNRIEKKLFRYSGINEWGSTFERSKDLETWLLGSKDDKALILGSSVAYRNINPYILADSTNYDWFNCASSSQAPNVSKFLLTSIINNKTNILLLDVYDGVIANNGYEGLEDWVNNANFNFIEKSGLITAANKSVKLYLKAFYISCRKLINHHVTFIPSKRNGTYKGKGFVCSPDGEYSIKDIDSTFDSINYFKIDALNKLVEICDENNIKLILVKPPLVNKTVTDNLEEYCKEKKLLSLDFERNKFVFRHREKINFMYYDNHHMTCYGSEIYSKELAKELKGLLVKMEVK